MEIMETKRKKRERKIGSVNLNSTELPEIKSWPIKGEYEITLKVKMTSLSEVDAYEQNEYININKDTINARFEILSVKSQERESEKEEEQEKERGKLNNPVSIKLGN